jgi:hypothetical protein
MLVCVCLLGDEFKAQEEFGDGLAVSLVLADEFGHCHSERLGTTAALLPDVMCDAPVLEVGVNVFEAPFALAGAVFGCFDVAGEDTGSVADERIELLCLGLEALPRLKRFVDLLGPWLFLAGHEIGLFRVSPCRNTRGHAVKSVGASSIATQRRTAFEKAGATDAASFSMFAAVAITVRSIAASPAASLGAAHGGVKWNAATSRATPAGATTRPARRLTWPKRK